MRGADALRLPKAEREQVAGCVPRAQRWPPPRRPQGFLKPQPQIAAGWIWAYWAVPPSWCACSRGGAQGGARGPNSTANVCVLGSAGRRAPALARELHCELVVSGGCVARRSLYGLVSSQLGNVQDTLDVPGMVSSS